MEKQWYSSSIIQTPETMSKYLNELSGLGIKAEEIKIMPASYGVYVMYFHTQDIH